MDATSLDQRKLLVVEGVLFAYEAYTHQGIGLGTRFCIEYHWRDAVTEVTAEVD